MPAAIINSGVQKLGFLPSQNEARAILADLQSSITKPDGTIKPGVLKLMHTKSLPGSDMAFERKGWWQFWARRDSKMEVTAKYLNTLFVQAYGLNEDTGCQTGEMKAIMADFQKYLAKTNNRVGTKTLSEFIERFEAEHQTSMVGGSEMPPDTRSSRNENDSSIKVNAGDTDSSGSESQPVDARHLYKPMTSGSHEEETRANEVLARGYQSDISDDRDRDNPSIMYAGSHEEETRTNEVQARRYQSDISEDRNRDNPSIMYAGSHEEETRANETQVRGYQYRAVDAGHIDTHRTVSSGGSEHSSPTSGIQKLREARDIKSPMPSSEPEALNLKNAPALSKKWHMDLSKSINEQTAIILNNSQKAADLKPLMDRSISIASVAIAPADGKDPDIKLLGAGNFGAAISFLGPDNQRQVVKILIPPRPCKTGVKSSLKGAELSAAKLSDSIDVVKPTHYLIEGKQNGEKIIYKVPSGKLKSFLKTLDDGRKGLIIGTIMPQAKGTTPNKDNCSLDDIKIIAKKSVKNLSALSAGRFIHHDIKPDNILFDPKSKEMKFIDTGLMERTSKTDSNRAKSTTFAGTPQYLHPVVTRTEEEEHGGEVDMFSTAMTLLSIRYPLAAEATLNERLYVDKEDGKIKSNFDHTMWELHGGEYLKNLIERTLDQKPPLNGSIRDELASILTALRDPDTPEGRFLDFVQNAFDSSFSQGNAYRIQISNLLEHPFLQ